MEIELEENEQRKALTAAERSRKLVGEADHTAEVLRQRAKAPAMETPGEGFSGNAPKNLSGRPAEPDSEVKVAEVLGVDQKTLNNAKHHVAAIERYPVLGGPEVSQKQALELAKVLDGLPEREEWWPNARRNPVGPPPQKMQKIMAVGWLFKRLGAAHRVIVCIFGGGTVPPLCYSALYQYSCHEGQTRLNPMNFRDL